jgi:molybdopterin converting factor subunit 1
MTVNVKLFAILRERSGSKELSVELPDGSSAQAAVVELVKQLPAIADLVPQAAVAINQQYANRHATLQDGDELALIPPVSGG